MRPILRRREIDVLNGSRAYGPTTRIELQLCGVSDQGGIPAADEPIVCIYSATHDPELGHELHLPLAALTEFIDSFSAELATSPPSTHTSDGSPESTESAAGES